MKVNCLARLLLVAAILLPSVAHAKAKKAQADRELAKELSASLVILSGEIETFADIRDELARTRVRTMQTLDDNLAWLQEGNDFDRHVWEVVGETYRLSLFESVLNATDDIATRRKAAAEREAQQEQRLAATRSAVSRKASELTSAASSLAALAEPPVSGAAVTDLVKDTLSQLTTSIGDESSKLKQGLELASRLAGGLESRLQSPVPTD